MRSGLAFAGDDVITAEPDDVDVDVASCLIWGVDLRGAAKSRDLKTAFRDAAREAFKAAARSGVRHLVVVYRSEPDKRVDSLARRLAETTHADLERQAGLYVDVMFIDVTSMDDSSGLIDSLQELSGQGVGFTGAAAISWRELEHQSIHEACGGDYL